MWRAIKKIRLFTAIETMGGGNIQIILSALQKKKSPTLPAAFIIALLTIPTIAFVVFLN
jgi:hypothetical protein